MRSLAGQFRTAVALVLICTSPLSLAMDEDELKARLAVIEGWRLAPIVLADYCEDIDPEGVAIREQNYKTWLARHAELTTTVQTTFEAVIPMIMPTDQAMPKLLEELRGRIMMDTLNTLFYAKSEVGARTVCRHYIGSPASMNITPVQQSLDEIRKWRAGAASRQQSR